MRSLSDFFLISTNPQPSSCRPEPVLRWAVPFKHRHKSDGRKADGHPPLLGPLLLPLEDLAHRPAHLRGDPQLLGPPPSLIRYNLKKLNFERKNSFHLFSDSCSDYVDTTSGYHSLESETGPFLLPLTRYNKRLLTCFFLHDYHHLLIVDMFLSIIMSLLLYMMTCSGLQLCPATLSRTSSSSRSTDHRVKATRTGEDEEEGRQVQEPG